MQQNNEVEPFKAYCLLYVAQVSRSEIARSIHRVYRCDFYASPKQTVDNLTIHNNIGSLNLKFASPCIIIQFKKSNNEM